MMGAQHTADTVEAAYYEYCRERGRPYFGRHMWASQGLPLRHVVMQELVRLEARGAGGRPIHILEVGSWAGGSAITWAEAIKRYAGVGQVICVDPWKPYFNPKDRPDAPVYHCMAEALAHDTVYDLFTHNVAAAGHSDVVLALRGQSTTVLPMLPREYFDLVFVDGDHSYNAARSDLTAATGLVREGGILCGDDLELQLSEIDMPYAQTQLHADYIRDPRSGKEFHPGVTLAVGELFGPVSCVVGCWATRKSGGRWQTISMSVMMPAEENVPRHLKSQDPAQDPAFCTWLAARQAPKARPASSFPANGSVETETCHTAEGEVRTFLERLVGLCEQGAYHEAMAYYDRHRNTVTQDPVLIEFDRLVGTLRQKLAA